MSGFLNWLTQSTGDLDIGWGSIGKVLNSPAVANMVAPAAAAYFTKNADNYALPYLNQAAGYAGADASHFANMREAAVRFNKDAEEVGSQAAMNDATRRALGDVDNSVEAAQQGIYREFRGVNPNSGANQVRIAQLNAQVPLARAQAATDARVKQYGLGLAARQAGMGALAGAGVNPAFSQMAAVANGMSNSYNMSRRNQNDDAAAIAYALRPKTPEPKGTMDFDGYVKAAMARLAPIGTPGVVNTPGTPTYNYGDTIV